MEYYNIQYNTNRIGYRLSTRFVERDGLKNG